MLRQLWTVPGVEIDVHPRLTGGATGIAEVDVIFPASHAGPAHERIDERLGPPAVTAHTSPTENVDEDDDGWRRPDAKIVLRLETAGDLPISAVLRIAPPAAPLDLIDGTTF